jgi:ribosomal protein L11 methyltransferase
VAARAASWTRLRLRLPPDAAEVLGVLCVELGAPGAVTGQRDLRRTRPGAPPARTTSFEAYFPPELDRRRLRPALVRAVERLAAEFRGVQRRSLRIEGFDLPDYGALWREHFPPLRVGRRLLVTPSWHRPEADGRAILTIDPGRAFGTGHHPTTRGCLLAIEELLQAGPRASGLDLGCGTGILALAMRALGVAEVVAVDGDPLAREATRRAARENSIDRVRVARDVAGARGRFDLVVANLYSRLLVELAGPLVERLAPNGHLVVSGLLLDQEREVRAALRRAGVAVRSRRALSTWVTLVADRPRARAMRA